jgi:predicted DNA-binding transcriptional regulator YafY
MGQRSPHETLITIVSAFIDRRRWSQSELARHADVGKETVRKILQGLQRSGWPLEEDRDSPPHVHWSAPPNWKPGMVALKLDEVPGLLRVLARAPKDKVRDRLIRTIRERSARKDAAAAQSATIETSELTEDEERALEILQDGADERAVVRMRYFTASRRDEKTRNVSVHRIYLGPPARFVATCHDTNQLKWFRLSGVSSARIDRAEKFRATTDDKLDTFIRGSLDGYAEEGPLVKCIFRVRQPEAAWVRRNLLKGMEHETIPDGIRVWIETRAPSLVARFVVRLGAAAHPESKELAKLVASLAEGALKNANEELASSS